MSFDQRRLMGSQIITMLELESGEEVLPLSEAAFLLFQDIELGLELLSGLVENPVLVNTYAGIASCLSNKQLIELVKVLAVGGIQAALAVAVMLDAKQYEDLDHEELGHVLKIQKEKEYTESKQTASMLAKEKGGSIEVYLSIMLKAIEDHHKNIRETRNAARPKTVRFNEAVWEYYESYYYKPSYQIIQTVERYASLIWPLGAERSSVDKDTLQSWDKAEDLLVETIMKGNIEPTKAISAYLMTYPSAQSEYNDYKKYVIK